MSADITFRHSLEKKVAYVVFARGLLSAGERVIVALSGGADSVALLCALHALGFKCLAAHCNFHLRGDESMRDERYACDIADRLGCDFRKIDFDVDEYRRLSPGTPSLEMACRDLRYHWFDHLRAETEIRRIAVAHNADDNAETLLLNLLRGSSLAGLRGMRPLNSSGIIRPLLEVSRMEIEDYLRAIGVDFVTDSSNLSDDFTRNRLRHHVIPALQYAAGEGKNALNVITSSLRLLSENHDFYRHAVEEKRASYTLPDSGIDLNKLIASEPQSALLLYEWLSPEGFTRSQTDDMLASADRSGRKFISSAGNILISSRGILLRSDDTAASDPAKKFHYELIAPADFHPVRDPFCAYFDAETLEKSGSVNVRFWKEGDRLLPFGMKGSRLVSDIFSDAKLSLRQKQTLPLLTHTDGSGNEIILWVPGLRASRNFPVTPSTRSILRVIYSPGQ